MSILKKFRYLIFIVVTILQLFYFYKGNFFVKVNSKKIVEGNNKYDEKLDSFEWDILQCEDIEILNVAKVNDKWISEIAIKGDEKKLIKALNSLGNYNIENYIIEGNKENIQVKMEIRSNID